MRRIVTWGSFANDSSLLAQWVSDTCNTIEVLVHVDNPMPTAKAEFFTAPNHGMTVGQLLDYANGLDLAAIINVDWHLGNGRSMGDGSKTGPGKYHYSMREGGVYQAVQKVLGWVHKYNVIAIQLGNEQKAPDDWYAHLAERVRNLLAAHGSGLKLIVGGSESNMAAAARYADIVDPHLLRDDWRSRLALAKSLGKPVWVTEMGPTSTPHDQMLEQVAEQVGPDGAISVFTGNRIDFPYSRSTYWNFKNHAPPFQAWSNAGLTAIGRAWQDFAGQPDEEDLSVTDKERIKHIVRRLEAGVEHRLEEALRQDVWRPLVRKALRQTGREIGRLTDIAEDD